MDKFLKQCKKCKHCNMQKIKTYYASIIPKRELVIHCKCNIYNMHLSRYLTIPESAMKSSKYNLDIITLINSWNNRNG